MAEAECPPEPKAYVEIRRGAIVIVARVVWRRGRRFGARTQDRLDVELLIGEARLHPRAAIGSEVFSERRAAPRPAEAAHHRAERNRFIAARLQYAAIMVIGAGASIALALAAGRILSKTLGIVTANLGM